MLTGRAFAGKRLPLTIGFAALLVAAFGAGCHGFFTDPILQSIAINPTAPQVNVGATLNLQVFGTYDDGSRKQVTSGVGWSSSDNTVGTVTGTGAGTLTGVSPGSVTITASAQALSATAAATVIGNVTSIGVTPTSGSIKIGGTGLAFTFAATPGPPAFITVDNGGILQITPIDSFLTCTVGVDGSGNPAEICTAVTGAATQYAIAMTYPDGNGGTITSPTATLNVGP